MFGSSFQYYSPLSFPCKNISPNPSSKRGTFMLLFAKQKQHFFATVSLFEEGVREMLVKDYSLTPGFPCKNISPNPSSKRGTFKLLFAKQKQKQTLLATVPLFEEGVREMLAIYDVNAYITIFTPNFVLSILYHRLFLKS